MLSIYLEHYLIWLTSLLLLGLLVYKLFFVKKELQIIEKVFLGFIGLCLLFLLVQTVRQPSLNTKVSEFSKAINLTANEVQKITLETNTNYPISFEISNSIEIEKILNIIRFNNQTAMRIFGDNSEKWKLIIETKNKTLIPYQATALSAIIPSIIHGCATK